MTREQFDAPLAPLTTLEVGGAARRLLTATTRDELVSAITAAEAEVDDWLLLGGGSNVVIADTGFDGTVVRVATRGIERLPDAAVARPIRLRVEAGEPWDDVVAAAVGNGWAGIETLSGIPGSAGAAPVQNIGAYGQELSSSLVAIDLLDPETGEVQRVDAADLELGYRTSSLKRGRRGAVVSLELALVDTGGIGLPIAYAQLADALGVALGETAPLADVRDAVLRLRAGKGMLLDAADPDSRSAGSFFTNPIVRERFARGLPAAAPRWPIEPEPPDRVLPLGAEVPPLPQVEQRVKLSAAWLIERAGIRRGFALPGSGAAVSGKHTLAIVNRGGATARDIEQLAGYIQTRVLNEFGVRLQPEPVLVGVQL